MVSFLLVHFPEFFDGVRPHESVLFDAKEYQVMMPFHPFLSGLVHKAMQLLLEVLVFAVHHAEVNPLIIFGNLHI